MSLGYCKTYNPKPWLRNTTYFSILIVLFTTFLPYSSNATSYVPSQKASRTLPMGQRESREYDTYGRVSKQYDFKGQVSESLYDALGRIERRNFYAAGSTTR